MIINILFWENDCLISHYIQDDEIQIFDNINFQEFRQINDLSNYKVSIYKNNDSIFEVHRKLDLRLIDNVYSKILDPLKTSICIMSSIHNPPMAIRDKFTRIQKLNCDLLHSMNELKIFIDLHKKKLKINNQDYYPVQQIHSDIHSLFHNSISERKNKLTFKSDIEQINFDYDKLLQIITTIVKNANQYTSDGIISIHISYFDETIHANTNCPFIYDYENSYIIFKIKNNGTNLEQNTQNYLKNIFNIEDTDYTDANFGFGLIIAYQLCSLFKGKLWFINSEEMGVGFFFTLQILS